MRKLFSRLVVLTVMLGALGGMAAAQDLRPLGTDIGTLLNGVGESMLPNMQQSVLADQGIGAASMGSSRFYAGFAAGVTFGSPGLLAVLTQSPSPFQLIDVNGLLSNLSSNSTVSNALTSIENMSSFPYPNLKLVAGLRLFDGIELTGNFAIVPQGLTDFVTNLAGLSSAGITLHTLEIGVHIRKVLIQDSGAMPAVSIGAGYSYANFTAGYPLPTQSQPFSGYNLTYGGTLGLDSTINTAGVDVTVSKHLLIFTPYIRISPWYQWATFNGTVSNFTFSLTNSSGQPVSGVIAPSTPNATINLDNLAFILAGGIEVNLGAFSLVPAGSYDLSTGSFSANLSSRVQF